MAFVKQYPHFLFLATPGETVRNDDGDFVAGTPTNTFLSSCREETDGRGSEIQVGGVAHKVTSLIQLPKTCPDVALGAKVIVANDANCSDVRITGVCLNFKRDQLHARLWL
jgi:hypothetical protein